MCKALIIFMNNCCLFILHNYLEKGKCGKEMLEPKEGILYKNIGVGRIRIVWQ